MNVDRIFMALAAALALAAPVAVVARGPAARPGVVYLIAAPWDAPGEIVTRAGGRLVGPRQPMIGALAAGDGAGFAARLRRAGAWVVLTDPAILALCGARA